MPENSPWSRPLTGTPLEYVPIDIPSTAATPTVFTAPVIRRAVVAALVAAIAVAGFVFPAFGAGIIALVAMVTVIWGADKLTDRLNKREDVSTPANWPDPFSWVSVVVALAIILAVVYFI